MNKYYLQSALCIAIVLICSASNASFVTYTDQAAFLNALPSSTQTLNFDSLSAGTAIANGDTFSGITFNYNFDGISMAVTDGDQFDGGGPFDTTSGSQFLGTNDFDIFLDGDDFNLSFAPVNAIGMMFITADAMFENDIILSTDGGSIGLSVADAGADLGDGSIPYFLGIIDNSNSFTSANITTTGNGFFLYNVDDITTAVVPLPGALWWFGSGLVGLMASRRRNQKLHI